LKKDQFLVIMVAALVMLAALPLSFQGGSAGRVTKDTPLPKLSESVGQSQPYPSPSQTDNSTTPTSSSGVVKASFTVVSQTVSDQRESGTSPTSNAPRDPSDASPAIPAQAVSGAAANDQPIPGDQLGTATDARPKSDGLTVGRALLITAWAAEMVLVCGVAFIRVRARKRSLGHTATN
jgi:hypothetical protein